MLNDDQRYSSDKTVGLDLLGVCKGGGLLLRLLRTVYTSMIRYALSCSCVFTVVGLVVDVLWKNTTNPRSLESRRM